MFNNQTTGPEYSMNSEKPQKVFPVSDTPVIPSAKVDRNIQLSDNPSTTQTSPSLRIKP